MTTDDTLTGDITALRQAAESRDPEQTQFLLKRIFLNMPFFRALAVVIERVHHHLPQFEAQHPDPIWARQALVQMTTLGTAPGKLPEDALDTFTSPGTANFLKALSDVAHSLQQTNQLEARVGYLVSATVNAIMADVVYRYYVTRPKAWEKLRTADIDPTTGHYTDPAVTQIALDFWTDADVAEHDVNGWLRVIEAIDTHSQRRGFERRDE